VRCGQIRLGQDPSNLSRQALINELPCGQIDGYTDGTSFSVPRRCLLARLLKHEDPDGNDQAGFLGDRDECERWLQSARWMDPANQSLCSDRAFIYVNDRLVLQQKLPPIDGVAKITFYLEPAERGGAQ